MEWESLPGGDLVRKGLRDLAEGRETDESLLVRIAGPRLRRLGFEVPVVDGIAAERRLYDRLETADPRRAHSRFNALIRRLVSFERVAGSRPRR